MAKNLKPCNFIVKTGGEALSSVEATAKALSEIDNTILPKLSKLAKIGDIYWHGTLDKKLEYSTKGTFVSKEKSVADYYAGRNEDSFFNFISEDSGRVIPFFLPKKYSKKTISAEDYMNMMFGDLWADKWEKYGSEYFEDKIEAKTNSANNKLKKIAKNEGLDAILIEGSYDGTPLKDLDHDQLFFANNKILQRTENALSEAYQAAKKDGTNPELVKAVEDLLGTGTEVRLSYDEMRQYLFDNPQLWQEGKAERRKIGGGKKAKKGQITLKDGEVITPTTIDGQTIFYHGSTKPRKGRLRANWAEGFGEAVYFGTDKRAIEEDYEEQYTTTAHLNLKKPLYYNNKKDWDAVIEKAVELYSRKETPKLLDEYSRVVNGVREWYDEDAKAEYESKGYIEPTSAENWVREEDATWINKAARELEYDAIIAPHHSFGNEIAVLDENAIIYPEEIKEQGITPEQKLKQAFDEWKAENNKLGITINWEKLIESDKKLLKAIYNYIKDKIAQGKYSFEDFVKEYGNRIKNFESQKGKWQSLYNKAAKEAGETKAATPPPPTKPPVTKTEAEGEEGGKNKPVRELPAAPEGQVVRAVLGRFFQAAKSEKVADAILKTGLFRTPGTIDEAFENGRKFVDDLGWDGAYELFQNLSTGREDGIVLDENTRMGIFAALTEDLQEKIDNPVSDEQQKADIILMAEVMAKGSELVSGGAKRMRLYQEILNRSTVPYQYDKRVKEWKALFPDSEIPKELEDKIKEAEVKYQELNRRYNELAEKQKKWEESQATKNIQEDIESRSKAAKKAPTSVLKKLAERVRKLGFSKPGMFSAATPASLAWDAAVEAVAVTLEAGGSVEIAIKKGIQAIRDSKWYKGLSDSKKKKAEAEFINHYADLEEEGVGMVEVIKGNVVVPHSLIRYYVAEGMTDIEQIAETIREGLSEKHPEITNRDIRDAITGYSKKIKKQTPDEIRNAVNTLKKEGRLRSQLEDLQKGIVKEKDPKQKAVLSELAKNLMKEIDKIHQEMFGHTSRQMSDAERLAAYKKRTTEKIKELRRKLDEGDYTKKPPRPPFDFDEEATNIEREKSMLDDEWAEAVKEEEKRRMSGAAKVGSLLLDVWNVSKGVKVGIDFGFAGINAALASFNSATQTAKAFANAWKSMWSPSNYQKIDVLLKSDPKYISAKQAGLKFYSIKDYEAFKGDLVTISALQRAWNAVGQGLAVPLSKSLGKEKSEQFYKQWRQRNPIAGLERAGAALVNTLNLGLYLRGAEIAAERGFTSYKTDPQAFKDLADLANTFSRRSSLAGLERSKKAMTIANALLFSAQNWASIIKILSPYTLYWVASKRAGTTKTMQLSPFQQVYGEIFMKMVGSYLGTLVLVKLMTGWEDDDISDEERKRRGVTTVNLTNPRRSDWLKIHGPNTTYDLFSGLTQEVILTYRILAEYFGERGFVSSKTGIESHLGEGNTPTPIGLALKQAEGKLSPSARYAYLWLNSTAVKGQPSYIRKIKGTNEEVNMKEEFKDMYTNLTYETIKDEFKDRDVVPAAFASLLGVFGYGVTREERAEEKAIGRQIQETLAPERKFNAYERAFKEYAKDGDVELAKKVFNQALQGKSEAKKSIEMFKEMGDDKVPERYKLESKDFDELLTYAKTGIPIDVSYMSDNKAARMKEINSLSKEALDRIKSDYGVQYDELQAAARVLKELNIKNSDGDPIDWDYRMSKIPWVKKYRKIILGVE